MTDGVRPRAAAIAILVAGLLMPAPVPADQTGHFSDPPSVRTPAPELVELRPFDPFSVQPVDQSVELPPTVPPPAAGPSRVHVLYDPSGPELRRRMVEVADLFPGETLAFQWAPDKSNRDPVHSETGRAQGKGVLTWRVRGIPSYDDRNTYARFEGELMQGYPHGHGIMRYRSGRIYAGAWAAGRPHGRGWERTAEGDHFWGVFSNGSREGAGRLVMPDGTAFVGTFQAGLRHGDFTVTLPGGTSYRSTWSKGQEVRNEKPNAFADATLGGLLKAQSGDAASRVSASVVLDSRTTSQADVRYIAVPNEGRTLVYTEDPMKVNIWNGAGPILSGPEAYFDIDADWENSFVYLNLMLQTMDGGSVVLDSLWLEATASIPYQRPMLMISSWPFRDNGYYPGLKMENKGWGAVTDGTLSFRFMDPVRQGAGSPIYTQPITGFDQLGEISVENFLIQNGVDVNVLRNGRFQCSSPERAEQCVAEVLSRVNLGALRPYVTRWDDLLILNIEGQMEYGWINGLGQPQRGTQPFRDKIYLLRIENISMAEMGAGWADTPTAPRHVDIRLPVGRSQYRIDLPFRAASQVRQVVYPMKFRAAQSSMHDFRFGARFSDGSIRYSAPVILFYFRPRS